MAGTSPSSYKLPHWEALKEPELNPAEFAYLVLGLNNYPWQDQALLDVASGDPTALLAANGSGKSAQVVVALILWFLWAWPKGKVVVVSAVWRQILYQVFPALERFKSHPFFKDWEFTQAKIVTPEGGFCIGFSTKEGGRAEGWHWGGPDVPLLYVVDEAKTVADQVFESVDRCTRQMQLFVSSAGGPFGQFFRCFNRERKFFRRIRVTSADCPHIPPSKIEADRLRYGEAHPLFRSIHLSEFTELDGQLILGIQELDLALENQPTPEAGEVVGFCDFARGRDENTFAVRRGNSIRLIKAWREADTVKAVEEFIRMFRAQNMRSRQVWGDADGLGGPICDVFKSKGQPINEFHGGLPCSTGVGYQNLISEAWYRGAEGIKSGAYCFPEGLDPIAFEQMTTRPGEWSLSGKLGVLPKSQPRAGAQGETRRTMASLGLPSPDRADAIFGVAFVGSRLTGSFSTRKVESSHIPKNPMAATRERF